jgi:hypothetical protein
LDVTEFDHRGINELIFEENGVVIRAIPTFCRTGKFHSRLERPEVRLQRQRDALSLVYRVLGPSVSEVDGMHAK